MTPQPCPYCGFTSPEISGPTHEYLLSTPGCWKAYGDILAREYTDIAYAFHHDLSVDAYALQHYGVKSQQTIRSANIHLISLYAYFISERETSELSMIKQKASQLKDLFVWLDPPKDMSPINIQSLLDCSDPDKYAQAVKDWAKYIFDSWEDHHDTVKPFVTSIL